MYNLIPSILRREKKYLLHESSLFVSSNIVKYKNILFFSDCSVRFKIDSFYLMTESFRVSRNKI